MIDVHAYIAPEDTWPALLQAVRKFKALRPWEWMADSDVFAVENPETHQVGYCSILGALDQIYALNVYPGSAGWDSYHQMKQSRQHVVAGPSLLEGHRLLNSQTCICAILEDRHRLEPSDYQLIQAHNFRFRGNKAWPLFRSFQPGFVPWFVDSDEAHFLTLALEQAVLIAQRVRLNPDTLATKDGQDNHCLVRVYRNAVWQDEWQPLPQPSNQLPTPHIDELQLARVKRANYNKQGTWETDCIPMPIVIEEGRRPFYPWGCPVLGPNGEAYQMEMLPLSDLARGVPYHLLKLIEQQQTRPQQLTIGSEYGYQLLKPIAEPLGIHCIQQDGLTYLPGFMQGMEQLLSSTR